MLRHLMLALAVSLGLSLSIPAFAQDQNQPSQDKNLDIRSSYGDLHMGDDADAKKVGLPLYPGAHVRPDKENNKNQANLSVATELFGMKLIVASYESDDDPAKVIDFYRGKLKKYGAVLECHSNKHGADIDVHADKNNKDSKDNKLTCDENDGPVVELKTGTDDNQRIVAVEPRDSGSGAKFSLVYVHTRGKAADI
jgi:hypothetical protein